MCDGVRLFMRSIFGCMLRTSCREALLTKPSARTCEADFAFECDTHAVEVSTHLVDDDDYLVECACVLWLYVIMTEHIFYQYEIEVGCLGF